MDKAMEAMLRSIIYQQLHGKAAGIAEAPIMAVAFHFQAAGGIG